MSTGKFSRSKGGLFILGTVCLQDLQILGNVRFYYRSLILHPPTQFSYAGHFPWSSWRPCEFKMFEEIFPHFVLQEENMQTACK